MLPGNAGQARVSSSAVPWMSHARSRDNSPFETVQLLVEAFREDTLHPCNNYTFYW